MDGQQHLELTANVLWQIWKDRNDKEFKGKDNDRLHTINKAMNEWMEFTEAICKGKNRSIEETSEGMRGDEGNGDGTEEVILEIGVKGQESSNILGIGVVATTTDNQRKEGWALVERSSSQKLQDDAMATRLALIKGWTKVKVLINNKRLVNMMQQGTVSDIKMAALVEDIRLLEHLFRMCSFGYNCSTNMDLCNSLSCHALSSYCDEERIFPFL